MCAAEHRSSNGRSAATGWSAEAVQRVVKLVFVKFGHFNIIYIIYIYILFVYFKSFVPKHLFIIYLF